ncbi:MAG: c-type cytochrome biogenesis protein CcmI [Gammaproteobacteria bacterium]|nr:c-type cytochrome biogenesis protein CcmI [Gammaproteobacteria bacterium]MDH3413393.1 c-type cytochrome biogenesis protein CcmI [Gammaproteobacteria bacterium]
MNSAYFIGFWLIAALLVAVALIFLLPPLLGRSRRKFGPDSREINAAVYQARLEELQREVDDGTLDSKDLDQAKSELQREILENVNPEQPAESGAKPSKAVALGVAALLPVLAVGLYLLLGAPEAIGWKRPAAEIGGGMGLAASDLDRTALERMTASFAQRLAENPEEGESWLVLGRTYVMLDQYDRAVEAFAKANALLGDTPDVLVDYAEAEAMANNNRFSDQARRRIAQALNLAPRHEKGLWLGAFAAAQDGDLETAMSNWKTLLQNEPDPDRRRLIEGLIARVQGVPAPSVVAPAAPDTPGVKVRVMLDQRLTKGLQGSETVFIFAQDVAGKGPPVAVYRTRVDALPATITLDDSMSMAPSLKLSDRKQVVVTARVAISGDARPSSGDFQGSSPAAVGNESPVEILINEKVP